MPRVLMPLAPGFEEIEALAVVDILRRAGVEVVVAGTAKDTKNSLIKGKCAIKVAPDEPLEGLTAKGFDMIVLPGGKDGTDNLRGDLRIRDLLKDFSNQGKYIAAICAAPTVLKDASLTEGRTITCHPSVINELIDANVIEDRVVVDDKLITSQGPGTALEFAFKLVEILVSKEKAEEVNQGVLARL